MAWTGEALEMDERVVVSPAAGAFTPLIGVDTNVDADQVIGRVCAGDEVVDVCTPFAGRLVAMVAWEGERVQAFQRVAWLRAA
jgi:predicted deacylase